MKKSLIVVIAILISLANMQTPALISQADASNEDQTYVWKLVETIDIDNEAVMIASQSEFWKLNLIYSQGSYSAKIWHKDDQNYVAYGATASWSKPPSVMKSGEKITLTATLSETENTHKMNTSAALTSADFAPPERGVGQLGDVLFLTDDGVRDISINGAANTSASGTFAAVVPEGEVGKRIALRIQFYMGESMATYYVYEWLKPGDSGAKTQKPKVVRPQEIIVEFSDITKVSIAGISGQVEISLSGNEDECDFLNQKDLKSLENKDGMIIKTGPRSGVILSWADMTHFIVGPETTLRFVKVAEKVETPLEVAASNLWANIKQLAKDGTLPITMNHAVTSHKATTYVCEDDGTTSTLKVIEGVVEFTSKADGKLETVNTGEMISATSAGIGNKTSFDINAEQSKWDEILAGMLYRTAGWKLVETIDYENKDTWKASESDYWKNNYSCVKGNLSARLWHKDDQSYIAYGANASWSRPPVFIEAGEKVSLKATLSETENTHKWNTSAASTYADFAPLERGLGQRGDIAFINDGGLADISINGAVNASASTVFSATAPEGTDGSRIAIRLQFYMGASMGTYYIYEWQSWLTGTEPFINPH